MKIVLAYLCDSADRGDYFISMLPVGLISIAAYCQDRGFDVTLANFSKMGHRRAAAYIAKEKPRLLGVSLYTHNRADTIRFIREVRKSSPKTVIAAGGPHASALAEELIARVPEIDYIVRGEGEEAFERLAGALRAGKRPRSKLIESEGAIRLDELPAPGSFLGPLVDVDPNEQFKVIISSRGCSHECAFCCSPGFWGYRVRFRSAEALADEIEFVHRTRGVLFFSIRDDNFTLNKKRVMEFCKILRAREIYVMWNCQSRVDTVDEELLVGMKRAGMEQIQFGVESGSERMLRRYDKRIAIGAIRNAARAARRAGVYLFIYLMAGMEGEGRGDIRKTIALIRSILPGDGIVSPVALYPGTGLYESVKSRGGIDDAVWFNRGDSGIYLRNDPDVGQWIKELVTELGAIRERSWYTARDFALHHRIAGRDCWVTSILEGDYYLDEERYEDARRRYAAVTGAFPRNQWGFLRTGKLLFRTGDFEGAAENFAAVTRLAPNYYGGWLKLAESELAAGMRAEAAANVRRAFRRNGYDFRVRNLMRLLKA